MTTVEMILALVATGKFTLPDGLVYEDVDGISWFLQNSSGRAVWHLESGQEKFARDLCAAHFAQQIDHGGPLHGRLLLTDFNYYMARGNSEAAIRALWEAARPRTGHVCHLSGYDPMIDPRCPARKELEGNQWKPGSSNW